MLVAAGYHTVTPAQVAAWHAGRRRRCPPNALLLTFDGGRADTMLNAAPIVHGLHLRATVFVIGGAYTQAPVFYASPGQLRSLGARAGRSRRTRSRGTRRWRSGHGRRLPSSRPAQMTAARSRGLPAFAARVAPSTRHRGRRPRRSQAPR